MKVIVNADDFGYSAMVNKAIDESMRTHCITQTSLMVNMPACDEAVALARRNGYANKLGLHLNLGEGSPLTADIKECPLFCDGDGKFNCKFHDRRHLPFISDISRKEKVALSKEIEAQIQKYMSYRLPLMHIDGHYHDHVRGIVFDAAAPFIRKYGFISVRKPNSLCWFLQRGLELRAHAYWMKLLLLGADVRMVDYFGGMDTYRIVKSRLPQGCSVEIMVHPQLDDADKLIDREYRGVPDDSMVDIREELKLDGCQFVDYSQIRD